MSCISGVGFVAHDDVIVAKSLNATAPESIAVNGWPASVVQKCPASRQSGWVCGVIISIIDGVIHLWRCAINGGLDHPLVVELAKLGRQVGGVLKGNLLIQRVA